MIKIYNSGGCVQMTGGYFVALAGEAAQSCFGVAEMAVAGRVDTLKGMMFGKNFTDKGVRVFENNGKLYIEIHINVMYGLNITAIVKSIIHKVRYTIEQATDIAVEQVNVIVENVKE